MSRPHGPRINRRRNKRKYTQMNWQRAEQIYANIILYYTDTHTTRTQQISSAVDVEAESEDRNANSRKEEEEEVVVAAKKYISHRTHTFKWQIQCYKHLELSYTLYVCCVCVCLIRSFRVIDVVRCVNSCCWRRWSYGEVWSVFDFVRCSRSDCILSHHHL